MDSERGTHDVHIYAIVRVKVPGLTGTHQEVIEAASEALLRSNFDNLLADCDYEAEYDYQDGGYIVDERDEEGDVYGTYYLRDGATRLPHDGVTRCDACGSDVKDWYGAAAPGE
jgi:hypothetical protein